MLVPKTSEQVKKTNEPPKIDAVNEFHKKTDIALSKLNSKIEDYTLQKQKVSQEVMMYKQKNMMAAAQNSFNLYQQIENNIQMMINKRIDLQQQKHAFEMDMLLGMEADIMISNAKATEQITQNLNMKQLSQVNNYNNKKKDELDNAKELMAEFSKDNEERLKTSDEKTEDFENFGKTAENSKFLSFLQENEKFNIPDVEVNANNNNNNNNNNNIETESQRREREQREWEREMLVKYQPKNGLSKHKRKSKREEEQ